MDALRSQWAPMAVPARQPPPPGTGLYGRFRVVLSRLDGLDCPDGVQLRLASGEPVVAEEVALIGHGQWTDGCFAYGDPDGHNRVVITYRDSAGARGIAVAPASSLGSHPQDPFVQLAPACPGDAYELAGARAADHAPLPLDYWGSWLLEGAEPRALEHQQAYAALHFAVAETLQAATAEGLVPAAPTVIDVGCGPGWLLAHLRSRCFAPSDSDPVQSQLVGFDLNATCVDCARHLGASIAAPFRVEHGDVRAFTDFVTTHRLRPDVVICSGVLTRCVLDSADEAKACARQIHGQLRPGGLLLVTGRAPSHLDAEDFEALGFEVANMHDPGTGCCFYVLLASPGA